MQRTPVDRAADAMLAETLDKRIAVDRQAVQAAVSGVEVVYHTAAVPGVWGAWELFHSVNVRGTENVIAACRACGVRKLVFTSSPSVTFDGTDQCGVDESAPYPQRWLCHYPHTKALAEQAVLAANDGRDLLTCALRPHLIWGPRDPHLVPRLIDRARRGRLRQVGDGNNLQGYLMVWLRDPPGPQPAGRPHENHQQVSVQGLPGLWNVWTGFVHGIPIINWVRAEGQDIYELEFDVMDLIRDAQNRGLEVPGTHINAVAVGFEIWEGPITNLESVDFYVDVN